MAYHTKVERDTQFEAIQPVRITQIYDKDIFDLSGLEELPCKIVYSKGPGYSVEELSFDDPSKIGTLNKIDSQTYEFTLGIQDTELFQKYLKNSNFIVVFGPDLVDVIYSIKPSGIDLENIQIGSKMADGRLIGGLGSISSTGNAELWTDYRQVVFSTMLKRIFYNNEVVEVDSLDNELVQKIEASKHQGGGTIYLDTNDSFGPITINVNGLTLNGKNETTGEYANIKFGDVRELAFIGQDSSDLVEGLHIDSDLTTEVKIYGGTLVLDDCEFRNVKFKCFNGAEVHIGRSKLTSCSFEDCSSNVSDKAANKDTTMSFVSCRVTSCQFEELNTVEFVQCLFDQTNNDNSGLFISHFDSCKFNSCSFAPNDDANVLTIGSRGLSKFINVDQREKLEFENCSLKGQLNGDKISLEIISPIYECKLKHCFFNGCTRISTIDLVGAGLRYSRPAESPIALEGCSFEKLLLDYKYTVRTEGKAYVVITNCSFANPICLFDGDSFTRSVNYPIYLINSSILGPFAACKWSNQTSEHNIFYATINSIVANYLDPDRVGETVNLVGTELSGGYEKFYGSLMAFLPVGEQELTIYFKNEAGNLAHLNGCLKCLNYQEAFDAIPYQTLVSQIEQEGLDDVLEVFKAWYVDSDIFGVSRNSAGHIGAYEDASEITSSFIPLDYSKVESTFAEFETLKNQQKVPYALNEFDINPGSFDSYKVTWKKDDLNPGGTFYAGLAQYVYTVDVLDNNKTLECFCEFVDEDGNEIILSNGITLLVSSVPKLIYVKDSVKAWTEMTASLEVELSGLSDEVESQLSSMKANWYKVEASGNVFKSTSFTQFDQDSNKIKTSLFIPIVSKSDEGSYFAELEYIPVGFESMRIIRSQNAFNEFSPATLNVGYSVVIDNTASSHGDIEIVEGDRLSLSAVLVQGDNPYIEWQTSKNSSGDSWTTIYGPTNGEFDISRVIYTVDEEGSYYRLHAFNYEEDGVTIATEDYSAYLVYLKVLPKPNDGTDIDSSIVLAKISLRELTSPTINVGNNYRIYSSLDNVMPPKVPETFDAHPILHRRPENTLWRFDSNSGKYVKTYVPYQFPTDVDIDKFNPSFAAAAEKLQYIDGIKYGGKLYLLELDNLNDLVEYRINKPVADFDILEAYENAPGREDVRFTDLASNLFVRNNYIAIADPNASIARTSMYSEFEAFSNPELVPVDGYCSWTIELEASYRDLPIIRAIDVTTGITLKYDISYPDFGRVITVGFRTEEAVVPENSFVIQVIGVKSISESEEIEISEVTNGFLLPEDGQVSWTIPITKGIYSSTPPLIQIYDMQNNVVNNLHVNYDMTSRSFVATIDYNGLIEANTYKAVLVGRSLNKPISGETISSFSTANGTLYSENGYCTWTVDVGENLRNSPAIQIFDCGAAHLTDRIESIERNGSILTIKIRNSQPIASNQLVLALINELADSLEGQSREAVGRVLLFKYDGNAGKIKFIKSIRSPQEQVFGHFGQAVDFDEYGHILISAPGETLERSIGYEERNYQIYPSRTGDNALKFGTQGKVYVFDLSDLEASEMFEIVEAKQILSNETLWKSIDYVNGSWGRLEKLYRTQALYTITDVKTNGQKVDEGFSDMKSYLEYYEFNSTYDFMYKRYFPTPYTDQDFKTGNSKSEFFNIAYRQIYYTSNLNEQYGASLSCDSGVVSIGAPDYDSYKGLVELWVYNKNSGLYEFRSYQENKLMNGELFLGQNVESGGSFILSTYRKSQSRQAVSLFTYDQTYKLKNDDISISEGAGSSGKSFGNSLDSYGSTFIIASPDEGKIYRYELVDSDDETSYKTIQTLNMKTYGMPSWATGKNTMVITKDKILAGYSSYGPNAVEHLDVDGDPLISVGSGAVVQFTLVGGNFIL